MVTRRRVVAAAVGAILGVGAYVALAEAQCAWTFPGWQPTFDGFSCRTIVVDGAWRMEMTSD